MSDTTISIRTDNEVKAQAQEILSMLGLDLTTAINLFLRQLICTQSVSFDVSVASLKKVARRTPPKLGCLKGKIRETQNHDWFEPLEDFKEYM